jgi:hypothetical protein
MNDLVSEYQQYQDATAEEENEYDEEEQAWLCLFPYKDSVFWRCEFFFTHSDKERKKENL